MAEAPIAWPPHPTGQLPQHQAVVNGALHTSSGTGLSFPATLPMQGMASPGAGVVLRRPSAFHVLAH